MAAILTQPFIFLLACSKSRTIQIWHVSYVSNRFPTRSLLPGSPGAITKTLENMTLTVRMTDGVWSQINDPVCYIFPIQVRYAMYPSLTSISILLIERNSPSTSSSQPHAHNNAAQKAPETLTKRQRQNLQKREKEKAAKADAEAERVAALGKHKREAEKARMVEQAGKASGKTASGGMKATVDERGKLVWE